MTKNDDIDARPLTRAPLQRILALALATLAAGCTDVFDDPPPFEMESDASTTGTDPSTDDADDTMDGSTSSGTTETGTTGTTGPDGCPPAVFDVSRFDEACFQ